MKRKKVDIIFIIILIMAVSVFLFSLHQIIMLLVPYYGGSQEYSELKKRALHQQEETAEEFQVDFKTLQEINPDTVAWIRFDNPSVISYPVVKSSDNNEYLTKTFSNHENKLGAIFLDMRSRSDFTDKNSFIYGHNLKIGGEMFSQLNEYASEEFCRQNPYFYIYTPDGKKRTYKVFSAAIVKDTAENYKMTFGTEKEYLDYLQMCKGTSLYQTDVILDAESKILSLSTCTNVNEDERFLLQGVLRETIEEDI